MSSSGGTDNPEGVNQPPTDRLAFRFPRPWQPLTPRGAAAFSRASLNVLCCFQVGVALLSACAVMWFLHQSVFPVIGRAIAQLPEEGSLRLGELHLPAGTSPIISENGWMALRVDLESPADLALLRDLEIRFGPNAVRLCTGVGALTFIYPPTWLAPFNRLELTTWWEAWQAMLVVAVGFMTVCALLLTWWALATLYAPLPRMLAFFGDRDLPLDGAWRMSAAALLAGAVFLSAGFFAFGLGWIRLPQFLLFFGVHWVLPIVYLVIGTTVLPPRPKKMMGANPFVPGVEVKNATSSTVSAADMTVPEPIPRVAQVIATVKVDPTSRKNDDASGSASTSHPRKRASNPFASTATSPSGVATPNPFAEEPPAP